MDRTTQKAPRLERRSPLCLAVLRRASKPAVRRPSRSKTRGSRYARGVRCARPQLNCPWATVASATTYRKVADRMGLRTVLPGFWLKRSDDEPLTRGTLNG